jgi:hypothetical protein
MIHRAIPARHKGTVVRDKARTVLQEESLKDKCFRGENGYTMKAAVE